MSGEKRLGESAGSEDPADAPLREEDVTVADRLDDRVSEGDGLDGLGFVPAGAPFPPVRRAP